MQAKKSFFTLLIFKGLRNMVVKELCKAKTTYFTQLIAESEGSSTSLWKHLNSLNLSPVKENE